MPRTNGRRQHDELDSGLQPINKVARFLSLSRSKVYSLMETGELPYVKLGKSRRVRWEDVLAARCPQHRGALRVGTS